MKVFNILLTNKQSIVYDTLIEAQNEDSAIKIAHESYPDCQFQPGLKTYASPKERFDFSIKKSICEGASILPNVFINDGYSFGRMIRGRFYDRYLNIDIDTTKKLINNSIVRKYEEESKGHEITTGKFYSIASSSRLAVSSFCVNRGQLEKVSAIGDVAVSNLEFEEGCPIPGVSEPQMDVTFDANGEKYFIEVKCHEIFDNHANIYLSEEYRVPLKLLLGIDTVEWGTAKVKINKKEVSVIGIKGKPLHPEDFELPKSKHHFDFKQFLCHLMGILSSKEYQEGRHINFFYLVYRSQDPSFSQLYADFESEICAIIKRFQTIFKDQITFGLIYNSKFDTLRSLSPVIQNK